MRSFRRGARGVPPKQFTLALQGPGPGDARMLRAICLVCIFSRAPKSLLGFLTLCSVTCHTLSVVSRDQGLKVEDAYPSEDSVLMQRGFRRQLRCLSDVCHQRFNPHQNFFGFPLKKIRALKRLENIALRILPGRRRRRVGGRFRGFVSERHEQLVYGSKPMPYYQDNEKIHKQQKIKSYLH
ncbi:hypothetical protein EV126DRAFT_109458 [Verticillium dahliae]|nr:hypothetical protein EV126DRAFT_109458 [Verticillium dahliae]